MVPPTYYKVLLAAILHTRAAVHRYEESCSLVEAFVKLHHTARPQSASKETNTTAILATGNVVVKYTL